MGTRDLALDFRAGGTWYGTWKLNWKYWQQTVRGTAIQWHGDTMTRQKFSNKAYGTVERIWEVLIRFQDLSSSDLIRCTAILTEMICLDELV